MQYVVVRTDIRRLTPDDLAAALADGGTARDERILPEPRRQVAFADSREAALQLARALTTVGTVRSGRQRVKVVRLDPARRPRRPSPVPRPPSSVVRRPSI